MAKSVSATLWVSIERATKVVHGLAVAKRDYRAIDLSGMPRLHARRLKTVLTDQELLGEMLHEYPNEAAAIYEDVLAGRLTSARRRASSIGLTEDAFQKTSGGWIIIVVVVVLLR